MEDASASLRALLGDAIFVDSDAPMGEFIGELLRKSGFTLATAESCTGGYIAHQITAVAGSSAYFKGGVVAYSNELKRRILGVSEATLAAFGAVSEEVAREMAEGMAAVAGTDVAISTTGIAGPDGGSVEKPVGTVWIAVKVKEQIRVTGYRFGNQREANIQRTTSTALLTLAEMLQEHICGK
jgi:nicotinamide-nucleotide amidase